MGNCSAVFPVFVLSSLQNNDYWQCTRVLYATLLYVNWLRYINPFLHCCTYLVCSAVPSYSFLRQQKINQMKFLVTGGGGYVGFHIGLKLVECGHQVILLDVKRPSEKWTNPCSQSIALEYMSDKELDERSRFTTKGMIFLTGNMSEPYDHHPCTDFITLLAIIRFLCSN